MPPSVASQQEGALGGHGRRTRFPRNPKTPVVKEDELPRRSPEDELAALGRERILSDVDDAVEKDGQRCKTRTKWILGGVAFAVVVAVIVDLSCHDNVRGWLEDAFTWIEDNPEAGVVVFALIFCVATLLFIPGLILTIGAGVAFGRALGFGFGLLWGSISILVGALAACVIAFYLGRYVLHEQAQNCAKRYRILGAVNTAIETNGIKVMILLRLSPLVPFSGFNLIAGLTKASLRDYMIGCLGVIPGTVAFVFIGASTAGTMNEGERMKAGEEDKTSCLIRMIMLIVGACAAVFALVAVTIYARRALREALRASEMEAKHHVQLEAKRALEDHPTDMESGTGEEFKDVLDRTMSEDSFQERP